MKNLLYFFTGVVFAAGSLGHILYHPTLDSYCDGLGMEVRVETTTFNSADVVLTCRGTSVVVPKQLIHVYNPETAKPRNTLTKE